VNRGFTLLEVVLALALTVLLLGASMTFLWDLADRRATLARGSRDLHAATVFIERLEADLASGLAGDQGIGGGIVGTDTKLKLLTRGVWLAPGTSGSSAPVAGGAGEGDLQATEYEFDPTAGKLSARRYVVKPGAGAAGGSGSMELLSDRVERVRFRYYDGEAWQTSFDSMQKGTLPVAIEVAVWFTSLKSATAPPMVEASTLDQPSDDGKSAAGDAASPTASADTERKWRAPDRLRVIIVPDGPVSSWKEGA
jgi:prepilin-type N-terminal cleavage/methylation domain-containing protein